jgi:hypothetical protein
MTAEPHNVGQRVRSIFDEREGVVIESDPVRTLIEFEDEDQGEPFKHRKWLPTRHWEPVP